jgi:hypothetical protein
MSGGFERKPGGGSLVQKSGAGASGPGTPGKQTLTEQLHGAPRTGHDDGKPEQPERAGAGAGVNSNAASAKVATSVVAGAPDADPTAARDSAARDAFATLAPRFGSSFPGGSVHAGPEGDTRARAHGSKAVTEGQRVFLSSDVVPASPEGHLVMAHEMAHIVQQTAPGAGSGKAAGNAPTAAYEHEAHQVGAVVAAGGSASPALRTNQIMAQGYGSPEHQSMGSEVHSILEPLANGTEDPATGTCLPPTLGGVSGSEMTEQKRNEEQGKGATHSPGLASVSQASAGRVAVPRLGQMLQEDAFFRDRGRNLTVSLRNFKMQHDAAGPFLAIDTDPSTKQAVRYDVPVSPGDMTALSGDLYGSTENLRKAPVTEFLKLQGILDAEASWERQVAAGTVDPKNEPNFDQQWEDTTAWRSQPVFGGGADLGPEASATGGDTSSYIGLALKNQAHFGQDTAQANQIEIQVRAGDIDTMARGPQGNFASGNEQAWMNGHARALVLAREAHALKNASGGPPTAEQNRATLDKYGHEGDVPSTGLPDPAMGKASVPSVPLDADKRPLKRSSGETTYNSKLNDAYVENAGADHYLTDAYAAGHQIVRDVVGTVTDQFVRDKGGRDAFLEFIVQRIQEGAIHDPEHAQGQLGKFQDASRTWKDKAARGDSWLNSKYNVLSHVGIGGDGLRQELSKKIDDVKMHAIGAKIVHDYYNKRGMLVHNKKGMSFVIKGDGHAGEAPEARQIIAMAVLESRTQVTEIASTGTTPNPLDVWDYTPAIDKTVLTETSGRKVMDTMFADSDYLWHLIKDNFSVGQTKSNAEAEKRSSANNPIEKQIGNTRAPADVGAPPMQSWLNRRRDYIARVTSQPQRSPEHGTDDGKAPKGHQP